MTPRPRDPDRLPRPEQAKAPRTPRNVIRRPLREAPMKRIQDNPTNDRGGHDE